MKNIHILPTPKPSRLIINASNVLTFGKEKYTILENRQNIYITSDEEIKEGDEGEWCIVNNEIIQIKSIVKSKHCVYYGDGIDASIYVCKKIILTTDQDLIKDGVQAIPDEFLEWFVNNPSCEEVKVVKDFLDDLDINGFATPFYEIIIPKKEPKPFKQMEKLTKVDWSKFKKSPFHSKKETLEEVAANYANKELNTEFTSKVGNFYGFSSSFIEGAKWQAERMYSEEEIIIILESYRNWKGFSFNQKEWFEQFKKK